MGKKGEHLKQETRDFLEEVMKRLSPVGEVTSRSMFGGFGIFEARAMFALISKTTLYFKVDATTLPNYEKAKSTQHKPMPYYSVPPNVYKNTNKLLKWASEAITIDHASKKKSFRRS